MHGHGPGHPLMAEEKKKGLEELLKIVQQMMADGDGDKPMDVASATEEAGEEMAEEVAEESVPEEEVDDKKMFMKNKMAKKPVKSMTIMEIGVAKKPPIGKAKKYG